MNRYFKTLIFIAFHLNCFSQSAAYERNVRYLDSIESDFRSCYCSGVLNYPDEKTSQKLVDRDLQIIECVNFFSEPGRAENDVDVKIKSFKKGIAFEDSVVNGLIKVTNIRFNGNFIIVEVKLESIGGYVYRAKSSIITTLQANCGITPYRVFNFKLFKEKFLPDIKVPLTFFNNRNFDCDEYSQEVLAKIAAKHPDYNFCLAEQNSPDWIRKLYALQYNSDSSLCCYSYIKPNAAFISLVKNNEYEVIKKLLNSPNYLYSVNAMEALIFLKSEGRVSFDKTIEDKIEEIKHLKNQMTVKKTYDFFSMVGSYEDLKISNESVIRKYKNNIL